MAREDERAAARHAYRMTHFGSRGAEPTERLRVADPRGTLVHFGRLVSLTYLATKAGDPPGSLYEHEFKELPVLAFNQPERLLVIAGGSYRITLRGIVG